MSRACCATENELKQLLQEQFQLETRVFFSRRKCFIRLTIKQQLSSTSHHVCPTEFNEYSFPSKFDNDIKRKVKILEDKTLTVIFGRRSHSPKILLLKGNLTLLASKLRSDLTLNIPETRWNMTKTNKENIFHNSKAWWNILVWLTDEEIATLEIPRTCS